MRVGLPGLILAVCTVVLISYRLELQPLLGIAPNPETPNLTRSEINSHLTMLVGLAALTASGTLFSFALAMFVRRFDGRSAFLVNLAGWLVRLLVLGIMVFLLVDYGQMLVRQGLMSGGERPFMLGLLTVGLGLPFVILTWMTMNRLGRWSKLALAWNGSQSGALQRLYRTLNGSWRLMALLLMGLAAWALPLTLMDLPHPKAHTVSTLLDKTVVAQQHPLLTLAFLAALSAGMSAWFARAALAERTAVLDQTSSRIGHFLSRSGNVG